MLFLVNNDPIWAETSRNIWFEGDAQNIVSADGNYTVMDVLFGIFIEF